MATSKPKEVAYESLRLKIEKFMECPDKAIIIPDGSCNSSKKYEPPEFVRNVMGSSAGAGSGEFHLYRHLRRKEMTRLRTIEIEAKEDDLSQEYKKKIKQNERLAEERTAKRRKKREKAKQRKKKRLEELKSQKSTSNHPTTEFMIDKDDDSSDINDV
ncbi:PRKR-interacting protein 1-like protein, partial [Fragariocoptes setiger]